jgi:hypothetical protein
MTIPQNTHLAHEDLYCMKIFNYTLNTYVYYNQGLLFINLITWMSQPSPLKRISSRDSEAEDDGSDRSDLGIS